LLYYYNLFSIKFIIMINWKISVFSLQLSKKYIFISHAYLIIIEILQFKLKFSLVSKYHFDGKVSFKLKLPFLFKYALI